jgi:acyl-CoA thioesterase FadM
MARVRIELPENFPFTTQLTVRVSDLNYGNHLGNDRILSLCHEARILFLKKFGLSELDFAGSSLIMADAMITFKGQAYLSDELTIAIAATELTVHGFDLLYQITRGSDEIARVKTALVFFDYQKNKIARAPSNLSELLGLGRVLIS